MIGDIGLFLDEDVYDLHIKDGDLESDEGLETAVSISLFTERRVSDEELPQGALSKKGWWGDMFPAIDQDKIGSRLWTLEREKVIPETARRAEDYVREALNWLLEDGVADSILATATYDTLKRLQISVTIVRPTGRDFKFAVIWDKQELVRG